MEKLKKVKYSSNSLRLKINCDQDGLISIEELENFLNKVKKENFKTIEFKLNNCCNNNGEFLYEFYNLRGFVETIESDENFEIRKEQIKQEEILKKEKQEQANLKRKITLLKKLQEELNIQS